MNAVILTHTMMRHSLEWTTRPDTSLTNVFIGVMDHPVQPFCFPKDENIYVLSHVRKFKRRSHSPIPVQPHFIYQFVHTFHLMHKNTSLLIFKKIKKQLGKAVMVVCFFFSNGVHTNAKKLLFSTECFNGALWLKSVSHTLCLQVFFHKRA